MTKETTLILILLIFYFLVGDVPRASSYGVYTSKFISFCKTSGRVSDFKNQNGTLPAKIAKQWYRFHKPCKTFSKFCYRHSESMFK